MFFLVSLWSRNLAYDLTSYQPMFTRKISWLIYIFFHFIMLLYDLSVFKNQIQVQNFT